MAVLNGTKVMQISKSYTNVKYVNPYREYGLESGETLANINVAHDKNDEQFRAILDYYNFTEKAYCQLLRDDMYRGG